MDIIADMSKLKERLISVAFTEMLIWAVLIGITWTRYIYPCSDESSGFWGFYYFATLAGFISTVNFYYGLIKDKTWRYRVGFGNTVALIIMVIVGVVRLAFFGSEGISGVEWISIIIFIALIPYKIGFAWLVWKCYQIRGSGDANTFETL